MKANVLRGVGQALDYTEVEDPRPGPGEVIVDLTAASLNHRDVWIRKGQYAGLQFPIILGSDGVGKVAKIGDGVDASWLNREVLVNPALNWGDRDDVQDKKFAILGLPHDGTFAEKVKVPAENLYHVPDHMNPAEAASLPLAGLTAYRAAIHRGELEREQTVLVTGVGGGTAVFALQISVAAGADVFVTSGSDYKLERATSIGAKFGANYKDENWAAKLKVAAGGFDLIIDSSMGENLGHLIDLANPGGKIVFFGATAGNPPGFDSRKVFWKQLSILGTTMGSPSDFAAMLHFFEEHRIHPVVDREFPLADANAALDHMEAGSQMGKIVLTVP